MKRPDIQLVTKYLTAKQVEVMKYWCQQNFGARWDSLSIRNGEAGPDGTWTVLWEGPQEYHGTGYKWWFSKEEDASWFAMMWL